MNSLKRFKISKLTGPRPNRGVGLFPVALLSGFVAVACQSGNTSVAPAVGGEPSQQTFPNAPEIPSGPDLSPGPPGGQPDSTSPSWSADVLDGEWTGENYRINSRGISLVRDTLVISSQTNGLLEASRSWETLEGAGGHKGMTPVKSDVEELLGVFVALTGQIRFVEMNEPGTMNGRLIDRDTLDLFSTQPGRQPSVSHQRLRRVSRQASGG